MQVKECQEDFTKKYGRYISGIFDVFNDVMNQINQELLNIKIKYNSNQEF